MNNSCNCRCSFKNRSTLIIARLSKVFAFDEAKSPGGEDECQGW